MWKKNLSITGIFLGYFIPFSKKIMKKTICIGGTDTLEDRDLGFAKIEEGLATINCRKSDVAYVWVYGVSGTYQIAKEWTEKNNLTFRDATPNWKKHPDKEAATIARNEYLSVTSDLLIVIKAKHNTGGNKIIEAFERERKPIYIHDIADANMVEDFTFPDEQTLDESIKICSAMARRLIDISVMLDLETTGLANTD